MENISEFLVTGQRRINCSACEGRITYALRRLPGVVNVETSAKTQRIRVTVDATATTGPEQLRATLDELGYQVQDPVSQR